MSRELELELTFLAKEIPEGIKDAIPTRITDVYIPDTAEHSHLRLRKRGNLYEITKKLPSKMAMPLSKSNKPYLLQKMNSKPSLAVARNAFPKIATIL